MAIFRKKKLKKEEDGKKVNLNSAFPNKRGYITDLPVLGKGANHRQGKPLVYIVRNKQSSISGCVDCAARPHSSWY